ncbi:MAG: DUF6134 family protein [Bacteroidota bacterium]
MKHPFFLFLLYLMTNGPLAGQTMVYEIWKDGKLVGEHNAQRICHGDTCLYLFKSKINMRIIISINATSQLQSSYKGGILQDGFVRVWREGKLRESGYLKYDEGYGYFVDLDGRSKIFYSKGIRFSVVMLYHNEPKGYTHVFSERYGKWLELTKVSEGVYELDLPMGNKNIYTYKDGKCVSVEIDHALTTLICKLKGAPPVAKE